MNGAWSSAAAPIHALHPHDRHTAVMDSAHHARPTITLCAHAGVKTLDPTDWAYRGDYDNSSTADASVAKGFNYHQGPEWVWPFGYFLRARLRFMPEHSSGSGKYPAPSPSSESRLKARRLCMAHLGPHRVHMQRSLVGGLPELTNSNGTTACAAFGCACAVLTLAS